MFGRALTWYESLLLAFFDTGRNNLHPPKSLLEHLVLLTIGSVGAALILAVFAAILILLPYKIFSQ